MPVKHIQKILRNVRCKCILSWCWCSSVALALLTQTLPKGTRLDGIEWGNEICPMHRRVWLAQGHSSTWHPKWTATRQVHLIIHLIFHENRYQLLLLCLSLELSLWPSGISLGFWCRAWGWCGSPAWMAEEMFDFHLCSTLEIKKGRQFIRGYVLCIVPNQEVSWEIDSGE